jgi:Xaa-Pro dipeptidase
MIEPGAHLHFPPEELAAREAATLAAMAEAGLDALLLFRQESMYWLTGYDTFGYVHFQCLVLAADGRLTLLTRSADRLQARFTSRIADVRIWRDAGDAAPERDLKALLADLGLAGRRLGVEWDAYGLTALKGRRLADALDGFAPLADASALVTELRAVKSPAAPSRPPWPPPAPAPSRATSSPSSKARSFAAAATTPPTSRSSAPAPAP